MHNLPVIRQIHLAEPITNSECRTECPAGTFGTKASECVVDETSRRPFRLVMERAEGEVVPGVDPPPVENLYRPDVENIEDPRFYFQILGFDENRDWKKNILFSEIICELARLFQNLPQIFSRKTTFLPYNILRRSGNDDPPTAISTAGT